MNSKLCINNDMYPKSTNYNLIPIHSHRFGRQQLDHLIISHKQFKLFFLSWALSIMKSQMNPVKPVPYRLLTSI